MRRFSSLHQKVTVTASSWFQRSIFFERVQRMRCLWCWSQRHPHRNYPYRSSHMCKDCRAIQMAQLVARRTARATSNREALA